MAEPAVPPTQDSSKWLGNEFIFCLIPSYFFCVTGILRYYQIRHLGHTFEEPKFQPYKIVRIISYIMASTYVIKWIMSYISPSEVNLRLSDLYLTFLYAFPIFGWFWVQGLFKMELKRKLAPIDANQFLFSLMSIVAYVYKIIVEKKLFGCILFAYYFWSIEEQIFKFVFDEIETSSLKERLLGGRHSPLQPKELAFKKDIQLDVFDSPKPPSRTITPARNLPLIKIHIPNKLSQRFMGANVEYCFSLQTLIRSDTYKTERTLTEFLELNQEMKILLNMDKISNSSSSKLPELDMSLIEEFLTSNSISQLEIIEHLERYLKCLVVNPSYVQEVVLDFLKIMNPYRDQFLGYHETIESRGQFSDSEQRDRLYSREMSESMTSQCKISRENTGGIELQDLMITSSDLERSIQKSSKKKKRKLNKEYKNIQIEVNKIKYGYGDDNEICYRFELFIKSSKVPKGKIWQIERTYRQFKKNHWKVQQELEATLPPIKDFIPILGDDEMGINPKSMEPFDSDDEGRYSDLSSN